MKNRVSVVCLLVLLLIVASVYKISAPPESGAVYPVSAPGKMITESLDFSARNDENSIQHSSKNIGWGFKKEKGIAPYIDDSTKNIFAAYNTFYVDNSGEKVLYLTFDEGYENGYTGQILDVLKEKNVPAAFFITGAYFDREIALVERMVNEGHIVGNHTLNHPNLAKSDEKTVLSELKGLNDKFKEKFGVDMKYMRPPEGEYSEKLLAQVSAWGMRTVLWSFAYKDWDVNVQKGRDYAFSQITPYLHDGAIILLHAVSKDNAEAVGDVIDFARGEGYEFKSLDYLTIR